MLRLKWHFRNDGKEFDRNKIRPIRTFNPRKKDVAIKIYLSSLEKKLPNIEIPQNKYNNATKEEPSELFNLKNDKNIIIKSAEKDSTIVVWDRDDYIEDIYEEVRNDPRPLISTIHLGAW